MTSQTKKIKQKAVLRFKNLKSSLPNLFHDPIHSSVVASYIKENMIMRSSKNELAAVCSIKLRRLFNCEEPIYSLVQRWLELDKDDTTRQEIKDLWERDEKKALEACLRNRIQFGTAGLRAKMGAGFAYMNPLIVVQTSQGLAEYLLQEQEEAIVKGVVVGYDTRNNSEQFAKYAASAFLAKGIKVYWFDEYVPTPFVSFAVKHLGAAAGVMITASHNPAQDNGYKVYWSNGAQINAPHDSGISKSIMANQKPGTWDDGAIDLAKGPIENVYTTIHDAYMAAVKQFAFKTARITDASTLTKYMERFVYTPLHGVGHRFFEHLAQSIGVFDHMTVVERQRNPDPDFSTLPFPNPEEPAALDLAMKLAEAKDINFIIANDPDADRLAVMERVGARWHKFTGDQIGVLLAEYLRIPPVHDWTFRVYMLNSAVSSSMLARMVRSTKHPEVVDFMAQETLTGFKWLGNKAYEIIRGDDQASVPFAYEEALGYMFPEISYDKDGLSAATIFLLAMAKWRKVGLTPYHKLQELYRTYGFSETLNMPFRLDKETTDTVFEKIRSFVKLWTYKSQGKTFALGNYEVKRVRDLTKGIDWSSDEPEKYREPDLAVSEDVHMITFWLEEESPETGNGIKFTLRGSGTESKVKLYVECCAKKKERAEFLAEDVLGVIVNDLLRTHGLGEYFESNMANTKVVSSSGQTFPFPSQRSKRVPQRFLSSF